MTPMPRVGRKASSLLLFGLLFAMALLSAAGTGLAQDAPAGEKGAPQTRVVTIGAIEEGGACPAGITPPCWDTLTVVGRPGETISLVADLRSSDVTHNLQIREGTANDAAPLEGVEYAPPNRNGDATQQAASALHVANFTLASDFAEPIGFICQVHATTMKGKIVLPADAGAAGGGEPVHHLGVHFLAYWVGLIAFAILFLVYGVTFFLFKYNETSATTDQWDRTGAGAPETGGRKLASGNATLLAIVIGIVALAAVIYLARMG